MVRIDINLLPGLSPRVGGYFRAPPSKDEVTCVRCGYPDHVCHCHFADDLSIELDMRLARRAHELPDMDYRR